MGRHGKNKKRQGDHSLHCKQTRPKKKQKRERFWIEDCRDSFLPPSSSSNTGRASLEVLITQCQLFDDYLQVSQRQTHSSNINIKKNVDVTAVTADMGSSQKLCVKLNNRFDQKTSNRTNTKAIINAGQNEKVSSVIEKMKSEEIKNMKKTIAFEDENTCDFSDAFIYIKRAKSAMKPTRIVAGSVMNFKPLPNGNCGDGVINPYNNEEVPDKFWSQRRRLFTLFDEGIQMDKESWYSVTPEAIANHISAYLIGNRENAIILDPFCGCGGNAIAFAQMEGVKLVVCVDKDPEKLKMAASNANVYSIPKEKMVFIHGNAGYILSLYEDKKLIKTPVDSAMTKDEDRNETFKIGGIKLLPKTIDCIFLSPPWGGVDYAHIGKGNFTLQRIRVDGIVENTEMNGEDILNGASKALGQSGPIAFFLPKNINGVALGRSVLRAGYSCPLVLEKNVLNGKLKTVTAYIGL